MIRDAVISFPMFGESFSINPPSYYTLFGHVFYWYGVIIALGFLSAVIYCTIRSSRFGLTSDDIVDTLIIAVPLAIIGARLYYVAFNFSLFANDPLSIFKIWEGGLAIYGAIIGAVIGTVILCKRKKIPLGAMLDIGGLGLLIGQAIGRWANFINREAFGAETSIFCRMGLTRVATGETTYVHPTFLYESLWNLIGLLILHIYSKKGLRKYDGQLFLLYIAWYGLGRMFIEPLRTDSLFIPGTPIRISALIAVLSFSVAVIFLFINSHYRKHKMAGLWVDRVSLGLEPESTVQEESPAEKVEDSCAESSSGGQPPHESIETALEAFLSTDESDTPASESDKNITNDVQPGEDADI